MKSQLFSDRYLKIVLTVIAVCLVLLTAQQLQLIPAVQANGAWGAANANFGLVPLNEDGSITVKLSPADEMKVDITSVSTYDQLKVSISDINTSDNLGVNIREIQTSNKLGVELKDINTSDILDINIKEVGGGYIQYGGPVPVKQD